jgi:outer membrane lipoprotein SlyB
MKGIRMSGSARFFLLGALVATLMLAACATGPGPSTPAIYDTELRYGTIIRIHPTTLEGDHQLGVGAIMGAAVGGLLGSQIGQGSGSTVAAVIGAIGGGMIGNRVQNQYADKQAGSHVMVKLDNGVIVSVTQPADPNLRVGDRAVVRGSGQDARVMRL